MPKHKDEKLITRSYSVELRADTDDNGVIEGTPIVFGKKTRIKDWYGEYDEVIDARALDNADLKDVRLFVNHDTDKITLARSKNNNPNSTMSFIVDETGMHITAKLDVENNVEARAVYSAIKRGDVDGMSFMFRVKDEEWQDIDAEIPTRIIRGISIVHEVSVVNYPAYPQTSVNARSVETEYSELKEMRDREHARKCEEERKKELELEKLKIQILLGV